MSRLQPSERGSAIVELAILLPLFVMLLFWAVYFTEFSVLRIRQQEAARFLAWEARAHALADFETGRHAPRVAAMREAALARTRARYANLEGHNFSTQSSTWMAKPVLGTLALEPVELGDHPTDRLGHEVLGEAERRVGADRRLPGFTGLLRGLEGGLASTLRLLGFPRVVGARSRVELAIENPFLSGDESVFPPSVRRVDLSPAGSHLEPETWALGEGGDVGLADRGHPFTRQVNRVAYFGAGDKLDEALKGVGFLRDLLPFPPPVRVVSQRYGGPGRDASRLDCRGEALSATGKWRNGRKVGTPADGISPAKCFDTLPMEANGLGAGYEGDPSYRQLRARGEGYLGCPAGGCDD